MCGVVTLFPCFAESAYLYEEAEGIFNLHVGCTNTQDTSPDLLGLRGQPKHSAGHQTQELNPQPSGLEASLEASALTPKPN